MSVSNLMIGIGAEYRGKPAFKQAETSTQKLTKSVKNLAGAIGIAFGTRAVFNFARASLKAFQESEAQQYRLARLLEVTNGASAAQIDILTRQADALENLGVVSAKSITQVQSQLATFDLQILTINKLTPAILDYVTAEKGASATADDFKSATNGLAQALNGNFASLTKTGFVLDDVTKELISTGTESQRAAAIVKVLDSTYKGFNRSLRDTPEGKFILLANAADNARVIIGEGLTIALSQAFGGGDIEKAADNMESLAFWTSATIQGLGIIVGSIAKLIQFTEKLTPGAQVEKAAAAKLANAPYDPMSGNMPSLSPAFMALVKARQKADKLDLKRSKDATKELAKQTKLMKEQAALAKAKAILNKADDVFNIDLIQNTAALQGRITQDETLRLQLQQAILLGNANEAGNLAQQLLASQAAAVKLSMSNPLGGFTDAIKLALQGIKDMRNQLALVGIDKVAIPTLLSPSELLAQDYAAVLADMNNSNYQDAFARPNAANGYNSSLTATELRIFIDPSAAQYGIGVASVNNSANGNNNNYSTIQSFAGGRGL